MSTTQYISSVQGGRQRNTVLLLVVFAVVGVALILFGADFILESETSSVIAVSLLFFAILAVTAGRARALNLGPASVIYTVWWILLISEEIFSYRTNVSDQLSSVNQVDFASAAYAQAGLWVVALIGFLFIVAPQPQWLRGLFQGDYKWVSLMALICAASSAYSPKPSYSLAWSFKLLLVVAVVHVCAKQFTDEGQIRGFLVATTIAMFFLVAAPTIRSMFGADPNSDFGAGDLEQRFREGSTGISGIAGTLAMICLMLYQPGKRRWPMIIGGISLGIMIIAGGKAGIIAGVVSGVLFFAMQKKFGPIVGFVGAVGGLFWAAIEFTPLGQYFSNYMRLDQASSLSGRTDLWKFVMPAVKDKIILGHGFVGSRFVSVLMPGTPFEAGHMHNGFLEATYNNGIIGLFFIVAIQVVIVRNLVRAMRVTQDVKFRALVAGALAVYVNILMNAVFNATFGGRPDAPFMLLIALVAISTAVLHIARREASVETAIPGVA